jgi:hypothetical protein
MPIMMPTTMPIAQSPNDIALTFTSNFISSPSQIEDPQPADQTPPT